MKLFPKLFLSHLLVVVIAEAAVFVLVEFFAPRFFAEHVARMVHMVQMMGMGPMAESLRVDLENGLSATLTSALLVSLPLSALLAAVTAYWVSRRLARTANLLASGSRRMASGDYRLRLPVEGRDELAELAVHFNNLAEALERVEQTRVELIGNVAHELRTPLAALQGYAEAAADGVMPSEAVARAISREVAAMRRLVEDLSLVSRVEAGSVELELASHDPAELVRAAHDRFASVFASAGVELRLELPPEGLPPVRADAGRVDQVLANLLSNALRHTPKGGRVEIRLASAGEFARFCVRDTGPGIPEAYQQRIFERFFRLDAARSRGSGGSGVGLTVSKGLVEAMGGQIELRSRPGEGAEFCFTLPFAKA
ncbi:HAMP domain-containing sensor histidine kinase [Oceanithermus sp.]|uniref:sensor histidine kinase n=1 Tax=Oceanithermus sp. TaxID=2268145 RepID=UPI00257CFB52|nr:HAMP domain-containing sensor histidine kinase [Oceanithermus sp.]